MRRTLFAGLAALGLLVPAVPAADKDKPADAKPIKALLVIGGCCHDYAKQKDILAKGIAARANVEIDHRLRPRHDRKHLNPLYNDPDWAKGYDVVIHDECSADVTDMDVVQRVLKPHKDGLPAVVLHCGMHCYRTDGWNKTGITPWFEFTGLPSTGHGQQLPIAVSFVDKDNPITKGMQDWTTIKEELYNNRDKKVLDTAHPLARGKQGDDDNVCVWTNTYNKNTRVFATTLGHNDETVADDRYLDLVMRGLLWATNHLGDDGKPAPGYEAKK